ncbi:hypothetical protein [Thermosynechococcus sp. FA-CM-4201]
MSLIEIAGNTILDKLRQGKLSFDPYSTLRTGIEIIERAAEQTWQTTPATPGQLLPTGQRIPPLTWDDWLNGRQYYYDELCVDNTVSVVKGKVCYKGDIPYLCDKIPVYSCPKPLIPAPKPTPAPFRGGQCYGVPYRVKVGLRYYLSGVFTQGGVGYLTQPSLQEEIPVAEVTVTGKILGLDIIEGSTFVSMPVWPTGFFEGTVRTVVATRIKTQNAAGQNSYTEVPFNFSPSPLNQAYSIWIISVERLDGLPDNCGDPEGYNTGDPEPEIYPPPEPSPERPFDPYPPIQPFPIPFPIPVPLPLPTPIGFPFPFPMPIPTPPRLPEEKPMPIPFPIPKPDWIDLPPPWIEEIKNCPPPCPPIDLSPVIEAIARIKVEINNEFNLTLNARLDAQLQAILNLLVALEARLSNTLLLQLEPKFQAVLTAITSLELNLSGQITAILNGILELNFTLNVKADLLLQALLEVKVALLNAILSIEFSPTIQVDPVKEYEIIEKPVIVKDCEVVEKPVLVKEFQVIEKPLVVKEYEILEIEKPVEVVREKQPPLEQVLLPVVECREDGSPEKRWQIVKTLVGEIPTSVQQKFHQTADLAEEKCLEEADKGCTVVLPSDCYSEYKLESQLVIDFGTQYPSMKGSKWRIHIPDPIENLDWCTHFENLIWHRGQVYGRLYFQGDSRLITGGYFQSETEAYRVLRMLEKLSKLKENRIRVTKLTKPKRTVKGQQTRAVRASVVLFDKDGNVIKGDCWRPPRNGC